MTNTANSANPQGMIDYSNENKSLYVGNLAVTVTENRLFGIFSKAGMVKSIRVVLDRDTGQSLGYGYVNYHDALGASNALAMLNFTVIDKKEIRVMPSMPNNSIRKSGVGNIFIKNLDESIDNKTLYDTFSVFGKILSSKVAVDDEGNKIGYGFVHFGDPKAAENAISKVNTMEIAGKVVKVSPYRPREKRFDGDKPFTNIYVKNFTSDIFPDADSFRNFFEKYGEVTSIHFPLIGQEKSKGFGFVNFKDPEVAKNVVQTVNGKDPDKLYIVKSVNKAVRQSNLQKRYLRWRAEIDRLTAGRNIYIKNIPENYTETQLRQLMEDVGEIDSLCIRSDEKGRSKGFGFVCFKKVEDAENAIKNYHGKSIGNKILFVNMFQRRHVRQQQLEMQAQSQRKNMQSPGVMQSYAQFNSSPMVYHPNASGLMYMQQPGQMSQGVNSPARFNMQRQPMMAPYASGRVPMAMNGMQQQQLGYMRDQQYSQMQQQGMNSSMQHQMYSQVSQQPQAMRQQQQAQVPQQPQQTQQQQQPIIRNETKERNEELAEIIYSEVCKIAPERASKVAGMFLHMKPQEVETLLERPELIQSNIARALKLLEEESNNIESN